MKAIQKLLTGLPEPFFGVFRDKTETTMDDADAAVAFNPDTGQRAYWTRCKEQMAYADWGGHGAIYMAGVQTKGRGTNGRQWVSLPGNLLFTVILHRDKMGLRPESHWRPVEMFCGYVMSVAIRQFLQAAPSPPVLEFRPRNDFYVIDKNFPDTDIHYARKLGGVLVEPATADRNYLRAGIGVNVLHAPPDEELLPSVNDPDPYKRGYLAAAMAQFLPTSCPTQCPSPEGVLVKFCQIFNRELPKFTAHGVSYCWQQMGLMNNRNQVCLAPRHDPDLCLRMGFFKGYNGDGDFIVGGDVLKTDDFRPLPISRWR
jgi:hypothetical protein